MALSADKKTTWKQGLEIPLEVGAAETLYAGAIGCVNAAGYIVAGADTAGLLFQGISRQYVDNSLGANGDETVLMLRHGLVLFTFSSALTVADNGEHAYIADDETLALVAGVANNIFIGHIVDCVDATHAWVDIDAGIFQGDVATHIADAVGAHAASAISLADAGAFTTAIEVEAGLQEMYQHTLSAQQIINLPLGGWTEQDGTVLADFATGPFSTPGWNAGDKSFGIRWNDNAAPDPITTSVPIPPNLDETKDVVLHILAAKVGATLGDAVTFLVEAFNNIVAALYDADTDFGGTSSAMTGDATSKTVQEETLTLALADVAAAPGMMTFTLQPTDGTLGTDDVIMLGAGLEYTGKLRTA